jgi:molybdopterin-guanine dinucleotide biosynthesis adapter protein
MRVLSVIGFTQSGKTTTVENIIIELKNRGYSVGTVKEIHFEQFAIDKEGTNTYRHGKAGAEIVTARGNNETDILFPKKLSIDEILHFYHQDFVIMEGVMDTNAPKILTVHNISEIDERLDETVFAISGRISSKLNVFRGIPVINAVIDVVKLVDLIEEKVLEILPIFQLGSYSKENSYRHIMDIKTFKEKMKEEKNNFKDKNIKLIVDNKVVPMVPGVQKILSDAVEKIMKEIEPIYNME